MRVLLAGATGAIGRPLLRALRTAGHQVVAVIRDPTDRQLIMALGAEPVVADVLRLDELRRAVDGVAVEAVMHQATALRRARPRLRKDDPTLALRRQGSANLIAAARAAGARRFVTQSLITGYGYTDHGGRILTEDDPFGEPVGSYADPVAAATREAEQQAFRAEGLEGIALRYGLFYGPRAFSDLFASLMRRHIPCVPRHGGGINCWIHVADAADAAVAAMERGLPGQAYNIVDDEPLTWGQFTTAVARAHRTPAPRTMPDRLMRLAAPYAACLMIDTSMRVSHAKATRELGWTPSRRFVTDGLKPADAMRSRADRQDG